MSYIPSKKLHSRRFPPTPVQYFCISAILQLPTPYLSLSRIIKNAIDRASSSGRYLNFSSQRRRKILSTAASETERKRPDDAFLNDETDKELLVGSFSQYTPSTLHSTRRHTAYNVLGQDEIYNDDREDRKCDRRIHLAHVELQPVRCTKLCNQDRKSLNLVFV